MARYDSKLVANLLSGRARRLLFGHRKESAVPFSIHDADWKKYQAIAGDFYSKTQRSGVGGKVTDSGYRILRNIDFDSKTVVEIGPGSLPHRRLWNGTPELYVSVDLRDEFHEIALQKAKCPTARVNTDFFNPKIDLAANFADVIVSFYSLEHLHQLDESIEEYRRVLKPGGLFVGALTNEGGLLWGVGRFLLTRPVMRHKYGVDYDKIIAWEHPNYVDTIRNSLNAHFREITWRSYPFSRFQGNPNFNLISSFVFTN